MNVAEDTKYLNWKCIDNFEKVSDNKIFYNCKDTVLSEKQRIVCKEEFGKIKSKFGPVLAEFVEEARGRKKTHLKISGGNYTFFFILPKIVAWAKNKYPFLGIEIDLFERGGREGLNEQDADIILTSQSKDGGFTSKALSKFNYKKSRQFSNDEMFFGSSKDAIDKFGSKEKVLKNQDILFGRLYATEQSVEETRKLYSIIPKGREGSKPRITVDQYFLEFLFLLNSIGLGYIYTSMNLGDNVLQVGDSLIEQYKRFTVTKSDLDKRYKDIGRRLLNILKYREG